MIWTSWTRSNLNRQILHTDRDIGKKKTVSAEEKLTAINPDITIHAIDTRIDETNAARLVGNADGIVDAMDNYPTRYLLNDVAIRKNIPLFHGAIRGFYGQATTIIPGKTPCLKCIFPKAPPKEVFPVVGATPGVIGTVQATEVIKYLLQSGDLLTNRIFIWDGLAGRAEEIHAERIPCCPACGSLTPDKGGRRNDGKSTLFCPLPGTARDGYPRRTEERGNAALPCPGPLHRRRRKVMMRSLTSTVISMSLSS